MKAGIIAAGSGERLRAGGFKMAKPLVRVAGKPLIEHALIQLADAGIESVHVIVNGAAGSVADFIHERRWPMPVEVIVRTTAHSLESLRVIAPGLTGPTFLVTTVDTIAEAGAMKRFASAPMEGRDAVLAVTAAGADEKPLFAKLADDGRIASLGAKSSIVTAGWYLFSESVREAIASAPPGLDKLRLFLAHLVNSGRRVYGIPIGRAIDVDDFEDVRLAQELLKA